MYIATKNRIVIWNRHFSPLTEREKTNTVSVPEWPAKTEERYLPPVVPKAEPGWPYLTNIKRSFPSPGWHDLISTVSPGWKAVRRRICNRFSYRNRNGVFLIPVFLCGYEHTMTRTFSLFWFHTPCSHFFCTFASTFSIPIKHARLWQIESKQEKQYLATRL